QPHTTDVRCETLATPRPTSSCRDALPTARPPQPPCHPEVPASGGDRRPPSSRHARSRSARPRSWYTCEVVRTYSDRTNPKGVLRCASCYLRPASAGYAETLCALKGCETSAQGKALGHTKRDRSQEEPT